MKKLETNGHEVEVENRDPLSPPTQRPGLQSLNRLIDELNQSGIRYVQWKSNIRIKESLAGKTDLDLLIDLKDMTRFLSILAIHNVKAMVPAQGRDIPGISHYLGFDDQTGKFFHLHVHDVLVLGDQLTKNYLLPLEDDFLDCGGSILGVKVPNTEAELIVFSMRALLKYRDRDAVVDILGLPSLGLTSPGLSNPILNELYWLLRQTSLDNVEAQLSLWEDMLPSQAIFEFLQLVQRGELSGWRLLKLRGKIRRGLSLYRRNNPWKNTLAYFQQDWQRRRRVWKPRQKKMTLGKKGLRVAVVGADGAGKSTLVRHLVKWLSWRLNVGVYYMGKPRSRVQLKAIHTFTALSRKAFSAVRRMLGKSNAVVQGFESVNNWLEAVQALEEGKGRFQRFLDSDRAANEGTIVLYDRYPMEGIRVFNHTMDGPRIMPKTNGFLGSRIVRLAQQEQEIFEKIPPPDLTIILQASEEVLKRRKPEHDPDNISEKTRGLDRDLQDGPGLFVIQADQPLKRVFYEAQKEIWDWL